MATVAQPDQIDFIVADLEDYTAGEIISLASNVNANLRSSPPLGTPVDTGWARANWVPSIGEPIYLDDKRDPQPGDVIARAAQADEGERSLLAYRLTDGPVFSANSVAYIVPLNEGHSRQSPPGWVQSAMELAINQTESSASQRQRPNQ